MSGTAQITIAGERVDSYEWITVYESVASGAWLEVRVCGEPLPNVKADDDVEVSLRIEDERAQVAAWRLYCSRVLVDDAFAGATLTLHAGDPLALCRREAQFISRQGGRPVGQLANDVVKECLSKQVSIESDSGASDIAQDWLLQAHESGREFLTRVARSNGCVVYWDRDRLRVSSAGRAPKGSRVVDHGTRPSAANPSASSAPPWLAVERSVGSPRRPQQILWTDPESRETRRARVASSGGASGVLLTDRVPTRAAPSDAQYFGMLGGTTVGVSFRVHSSRSDVRLGDQINLEGAQSPLVITEIEHRLASGRYENAITLVPAEVWGTDSAAGSTGLCGPVQAEVSHNDDSSRQQRIRVILSEDPARRASPWIPITSLSATERGGLFVVPEVGDLVLVLFDRACPEDMYCIGAIRGARQKVPEHWASSANEKKAFFFPSGIGLTFDEHNQVLRLETTGASLELSGDRIVVNAGTIEIRTQSSAKILADGEVSIDGKKINLG